MARRYVLLAAVPALLLAVSLFRAERRSIPLADSPPLPSPREISEIPATVSSEGVKAGIRVVVESPVPEEREQAAIRIASIGKRSDLPFLRRQAKREKDRRVVGALRGAIALIERRAGVRHLRGALSAVSEGRGRYRLIYKVATVDHGGRAKLRITTDRQEGVAWEGKSSSGWVKLDPRSEKTLEVRVLLSPGEYRFRASVTLRNVVEGVGAVDGEEVVVHVP